MNKYLKYKFPLILFIILEKSSVNIWTSKVNLPNHYYINLDRNWLYTLAQILKKEFFFSFSMLIENSSIDSFYLNKNININEINLNFFLKKDNKSKIIYYYFYNYYLKIRLTFLYFLNLSTKLSSIDKIFLNANWIERETSEMYDINFYWKNDTRKLLIDYSKNEFPLLKDYPSEGYQDVFYNFFENQVYISKNEVVEL